MYPGPAQPPPYSSRSSPPPPPPAYSPARPCSHEISDDYAQAPSDVKEEAKITFWGHPCNLGLPIQRITAESLNSRIYVCLRDSGRRRCVPQASGVLLLNSELKPVEMGDGSNLLTGRDDEWWMRCGRCNKSRNNFLANHPYARPFTCSKLGCGAMLPGRPALEACAGCSAPYDASCVRINRYGEALRTPDRTGLLDRRRNEQPERFEARDQARARDAASSPS
ncbi:hypothetical protein B0T26DRAFT_752356 [Lasiosphaeria miniovina]|uniref:Uncharacterized protein n=1 Tax=Lasiosphaeria miniovina TaxID=1954250 RepID=A0AA40DYK7_9PEZI|nr:uncharacterized protein B0T26DRAFT_752356 [Lasiosphaeria miniovina]KAK0718432.1 hypothetical protein B0T26DRAFT_752356 [Lasiosphaeria miniovina]